MKTIEFPGVIQEIRWNPSVHYSDVIAVASGTCVYFIDLDLNGNEDIHKKCQDLLRSTRRVFFDETPYFQEHEREDVRGVEWLTHDESEVFVDEGNLVVLRHINPVKDMCWHRGYVNSCKYIHG